MEASLFEEFVPTQQLEEHIARQRVVIAIGLCESFSYRDAFGVHINSQAFDDLQAALARLQSIYCRDDSSWKENN